MDSVLQKDKKCYLCHSVYGLELHHCLHGSANRKKAEKYGLKVWLCKEHHTGNAGVHFNKDFDNFLKITAQQYFEENIGTHEEWMSEFGKNYL